MAENIRVLHVITRMVKGGAQKNTLATVASLNGSGWESTLATGPALGPEGSLEPECRAAGVRLLRVPELVREISPRNDLVALRRLVTLLRKERPHIVHTHTSKAGILGRIAARQARVPVVIHTPHGHVFHSYEGRVKTQIFIRAEQACAPLTHRLVALTGSELREHLEVGVGKHGRWTTVHSGVDFGPFEAARGLRETVRAELGLREAAFVLGTVGRLVPVKGQHYLVEAFARLGAAHPGLHLLMVGDGPLRDDLTAQARALGLTVRPCPEGGQPPAPPPGDRPVIHMLGLRHDVPRLLAALDLFVLPSLNEGMGRVLVEAMALELPCVASDVSGIPDVVDDGTTGLLVPPQDSGALARALATLLHDPDRAREMGRAGRRKAVPEFSVERMVEKLADLYTELLQERGVPPPPPLCLQQLRERLATAEAAARDSSSH
jgi:glycosyltransferase involved in cell wall biosynthesis